MRDKITQYLQYINSAIEYYRAGGFSKLFERVQRFIWWKWYRFRMHPKHRRYYGGIIWICQKLFSYRFSDAPPFRVIWVDPTEIEQKVTSVPPHWARVESGDWSTQPLLDEDRWEALNQRFAENKSWEEIEFEVPDKETYDHLHKIISKEGYKTQKQLYERSDSQDWDAEIGIAIGQNGELYWLRRGAHRIRIAKLLDLDQIPVHVRVRHQLWQALRDEVKDADSIDELSDQAQEHLDHPDLNDITPKFN